MRPRDREDCGRVTTPGEEVRQAARALSSLLGGSSALEGETSGGLRMACDEVERRLSREDYPVLVMGASSAGRRALVNAVLGERGLRLGAPDCTSALLFLRRADAANYVARMRDGETTEFAQRMPDRDASFEKAIARAEQEREAARVVFNEVSSSIDLAKGEVIVSAHPPSTPPVATNLTSAPLRALAPARALA